MKEDTITALPDPNGFSADPLTDLIRSGARQLIEQALEAELNALLTQFSNEMTPEGACSDRSTWPTAYCAVMKLGSL